MYVIEISTSAKHNNGGTMWVWQYLKSIESECVHLTYNIDRAERFATELDAKCAACYIPADLAYRIVPMPK